MPTGPAPLAVAIVTYNSADVLPGLLSSLEAGLEGIPCFEVIVVDNDSRDDSVDISLRHPIQPRLIRMGRNAGYAAAINAAIATIRPDCDVLVLNPDARLFPGAVRTMRDRLRDPQIGVVVPQILDDEGRVFRSLRREPSIATAWTDSILGGSLAAHIGMSEVIADRNLYEQGGTVEWATGAVLLISAHARRLVGAWDESFFLYSEEVDYMRRVRACGLVVEYVPQAKVIHIGGDTLANPFLCGLLTANRIRDYGRRHGSLRTALFRMGVIAGEALRAWRGPGHRAALRAAIGSFRVPSSELP
jgi:GT2 family glycosyltransferase